MIRAQPRRQPDRLAITLLQLANRVHHLDKGSRLQVALVVEDALARIAQDTGR
jgi:hypothetical protein